MSKQWDRQIPGPEYWSEMLRIIKPGGHLIAAGLPRMLHRVTCVIEDSGWQIRDLLMHLFGSGFPKSHNRFGLEGYGTALKPSWEGWILAMKPLEGTFAQNAEKWGLAGINIDACRIGTDDTRAKASMTALGQTSGWNSHNNKEVIAGSACGRWPANLILDEEAVEMLDLQTQHVLPAGGQSTRGSLKNSYNGGFKDDSIGRKIGYDTDNEKGASRFFYCAKASSSERNAGLEDFPLNERETSSGNNRTRYCTDCKLTDNGQNDHSQCKGEIVNSIAKPSMNNHPTVKPLALMQYLIKLIMPPNPDALLLDPFAGSGTTIVAAKQLRRNAIGIELSAEYAEIARKRIENVKIPIEQFELAI